MDAIALPAPHLALLFVERNILCPDRPLPSALRCLLLFHHRKAMLQWPQRTLVWVDGKYLSIHAGVTYSSPVVSLNWLESQKSSIEQEQVAECLNQQASVQRISVIFSVREEDLIGAKWTDFKYFCVAF